MNDAEFNRLFKRLKREAFSACDMSISEIAREARLSYGTIKRLESNKTKSPHYKTILKFLRAAGMDMELVHEEVQSIKLKKVS